MIAAIVYTTNTGTSARYAHMLGEQTGLPVCPLASASASIPRGTEVLYIGWIMASSVRGYKKAMRRYRVRAVCGVCMASTGSQIPEIRKQNTIPERIPVFTLQGGFDLDKLHGAYRFMMRMMVKLAGKGLSEKPDRTPEEDDMLNMMLHGGDRVSADNLQGLLDWYRAQA